MLTQRLRWASRPSFDTETVVAVVGLCFIGIYTFALAWFMQNRSYDEWGGLLILPVLVAVSLPIVWRVCRNDAVPMPGVMALAVIAKLTASIARYFVAFQVYGGNADAGTYHDAGAEISNSFRAGGLSPLELIPHTQGSRFLSELTGLVYSVFGVTKLGGFMVFSWLGFWGLFLMYRAALIGFPEIDPRRYALALFFLPSLLFWPSSIGKESWMMFGLGITVYGSARLLTHARGGLVVTVVGSILTAWVRPHVTALTMVALAASYLFRRSGPRASALSPIRKAVGVALMVGLASVAVARAGRYLGTKESSSVTAILDRARSQSTQGGSAIDVEQPNSPLEFPAAFFSVMFRPTLLEVRSATQVVAGAETTLLLAIFVASWRRIWGLRSWFLRRPYVIFCLLYLAMFGFAWSSLGNLGILARQRSLAWPFAVLVLAAPIPGSGGRTRRPNSSAVRLDAVPGVERGAQPFVSSRTRR